MNNFIKTTTLVALLSLSAPIAVPTFAAKPSIHKAKPDAEQSARLEKRLVEIKAMDIASLTSKEKRALRKEVKSIEKEMNNGGVYLSVGAIIIIVLLLILIL